MHNTLETRRLLLKPISKQDVDALAPIFADPEVMKFASSGPLTLDQTKHEIEKYVAEAKKHKFGVCSVVLKGTNSVIGYCGLEWHWLDERLQPELVYCLAKGYWGQGLGLEAAGAIKKYASESLGITELASLIHQGNTPSIRIAEKLGAVQTGEITVHGIKKLRYAYQFPGEPVTGRGLEIHRQNHAILYTDTDGKVTVDVFFAHENFWLTQKTMAELFGVKTPAISRHLKNIYASKELIQESTVSKMEIVQVEGHREITREIEVYNLDAVIAVGYRINSIKATHFRIWATNTLREFIIKGFVLNDQLLKNGRPFGKDYFDELLEKIREIRASERRAYQKIADVFEQCSSDYQSNSEETKAFYQIVQNQLHFATTGKTAAEIVYQRANSEKPFMGLTTWKNSPKGKILKSDALVAKNYLNQEEVSKLNRLVSMFIDFAELRALNHQIMTMKDWLKHVEKFLNLTDQQILKHAGKISHDMAIAKASEEYEKYRITQNREYLSDFDRAFARYLKGGDES